MTYAMAYLIITAVCLIAFYRSLTYGIVVDDIANRKRAHQRPSCERRRPLWKRLVRRLNGEYPVHNIVLDHAITLTIHTAVCCLMYGIWQNLPASILFALNVGNNQVSMWLNGKRYGVNAILCLLAYMYMPFGMVFWLMTGLFQVSALTFPAVLLFAGNWWLILLTPIVLMIGDAKLSDNIQKRIKDFAEGKCPEYVSFPIGKICFVLKTIAYYFIHGLFPYVQTMYPEQFKDFGLRNDVTRDTYRFDVQALAGLMVIALAVVGYIVRPDLFFGMMWWLITIAVFSNVVTLTVPLAERYMYLPNIGLMLTLAMLLNIVHPMAWMLVAVWYATRLWTFMPMYRDIDSYLEHHTFYYPENDQAWSFRCNRHAVNGDPIGVLYLSNMGLLKNQKSGFLWIHRAQGFQNIGQHGLVKECLSMARQCAVDGYKRIFDKEINKLSGLKEAENERVN